MARSNVFYPSLLAIVVLSTLALFTSFRTPHPRTYCAWPDVVRPHEKCESLASRLGARVFEGVASVDANAAIRSAVALRSDSVKHASYLACLVVECGYRALTCRQACRRAYT